MATSGGPDIITNGLVFGYDTGYGIEQHSSTRHYKGAPATNVITDGIPGYFGSGGETLYRSNHYGLNSDSGVFQRNFVTNPATANTSTFNNNAGLYKNFTTATLNSSTEYVLVSFDFYMITPYVRHSSSGTGLNGYMGILYTDGSTGNHGWSTLLNTPNAGDDWNNNSAYIGKWRKIGLIVDLTDSKTPSSISSMYIYNDRTTQGQGIFTNFIITEHTAVPTGKVLYTSGTRLDTQSIIDLKKTTDIDVSDISFDSIGQPTFDGTDDGINLGDNEIFDFTDGIATIEAIVKFPNSWTGGSQYPNLISKGGSAGWDTDGWALYGFRDWPNSGQKSWGFAMRNGSTVRNTYRANITVDKYLHIVATIDGTTIRLYENGVQVATNTQTINPASNSTNVYIGRGPSSQFFPGELPISKVYSSTLSAAEIKQNFNAYKKRFGI